MATPLHNPIVYFDPVTKRTYNSFQIRMRSISDLVRSRVLTRIVAWDDPDLILEEFPGYQIIGDDLHLEIQETYNALGPNASERLYEIAESYPSLLEMKPLEEIDWSPVSKDLYRSKDTYITRADRNRLLREASKRFMDYHKQHKIKPPNEVLPRVMVYYKKKLKRGKRSKETYRREAKYKKFDTINVRIAIADVLDQVNDVIDYFYAVAERPSPWSKEMEYRTIAKRWTKD